MAFFLRTRFIPTDTTHIVGLNLQLRGWLTSAIDLRRNIATIELGRPNTLCGQGGLVAKPRPGDFALSALAVGGQRTAQRATHGGDGNGLSAIRQLHH